MTSFSAHGSTLRARGVFIASIHATGDVLLLDEGDEVDDPKDISSLLSKLHEWQEFHSRYSANENVDVEAFCWTFTCGRVMEESDLSTGIPQEHVVRVILSVFAQLSKTITIHSGLGAVLDTLADEVKDFATVDQLEAWARVILLDLRDVINERRFLIGSNKTIGMGFREVKVGDEICILLGCSIPVILRQAKNGHVFISNAYVDGYMFGKATLEAEAGSHSWQDFCIHQ